MTERPILFSGEMVRAILEGRKTQTRRVVRHQPDLHLRKHRYAYVVESGVLKFGRAPWRKSDPHNFIVEEEINCPFGRPGDRLWVRETFSLGGKWKDGHLHEDGEQRFVYRADHRQQCCDSLYRWRPSIHMPRWASRITLEITDVRVERLQEISEEDAMSEGMVESEDFTPKGAFKALWNSLAKPGAQWADNPWVWCISFRRLP